MHRNWHLTKYWQRLAVAALMPILSAGAFRALLPDSFAANESSDYLSFYEPTAKNIMIGQGFTNPDGTLAVRTPPGYPLVLALIFKAAERTHVAEHTMVLIAILLLLGVASMAVFALSSSIWGWKGGLIAAFFWGIYPPLLWLTKQPNSEIVFLPIFLLSMCAFWRAATGPGHLGAMGFLAGVLLGCAMLVRPIAMGLAVPFSIAYLCIATNHTKAIRLRLLALFLAGNAVAVLPWESFVYIKTGQIIPLSAKGGPTILDGLTFGARAKDHRDESIRVSADVHALMVRFKQHSGSALSVGQVGDLLVREFRDHPSAVIRLFGLKIFRSWYGTDSQRRLEYGVFAVQCVFVPFILWALVRAWHYGPRGRQMTLFVSLILAYFWLTCLIGPPLLRYLTPGVGPLFVLIPSLFIKKQRPTDQMS